MPDDPELREILAANEAAAEALRLTPAGTYKRQARAAVVAYLRARAETAGSILCMVEADCLEKENARG